MTLTQDPQTKPSDEKEKSAFEIAYEALSKADKALFNQLELDSKTALTKSKPLLGIFKRRGRYSFVILREECTFKHEFEQSNMTVSKLVLDPKKPITKEKLKSLLGLLTLKTGIRVNGLVRKEACERFDIDYAYFEYHFDLEAE